MQDNSDHIDPRHRELIIGTMNNWLLGEPVWSHDEILQRWGKAFQMYRFGGGGLTNDLDSSLSLHLLRDEAIKQFGFGLPSKELLDTLERYQPILEVGAGTGYLTRLMRNRGIDVIGTDIGFGQRFTCGTHDPWQLRLPAKMAVRRYRDCTVFCSWPSLYETWFRQALRAMRIGQKLVVIEEDACAEDSAWEYRDQSFDELGDWIPLPAWPMLNDRCRAYVKKRHTVMHPRPADLTAKWLAGAKG
jgi:hypothetical protein